MTTIDKIENANMHWHTYPGQFNFGWMHWNNDVTDLNQSQHAILKSTQTHKAEITVLIKHLLLFIAHTHTHHNNHHLDPIQNASTVEKQNEEYSHIVFMGRNPWVWLWTISLNRSNTGKIIRLNGRAKVIRLAHYTILLKVLICAMQRRASFSISSRSLTINDIDRSTDRLVCA